MMFWRLFPWSFPAIALLLAGALALSPVARADFADGIAAYDGGDYETAIEIFTKAAMAGDPEAQVALANLYHFGEGLTQNLAVAANWYKAAAHLGDETAQANLGMFYAEGMGVERDAVSTYVWWSRAGAQGHAWAGDKARELGRSLDETQHSDAARRLRQVVSELTSGAAAVQSGEVLVVAGQTFRLDGIDAPTLGFHCPLRGTMRDCGLISA